MLLGACLFSANSGHPQQSVTRSIPAQVFREMEDYRPEAHHRSHRAPFVTHAPPRKAACRSDVSARAGSVRHDAGRFAPGRAKCAPP